MSDTTSTTPNSDEPEESSVGDPAVTPGPDPVPPPPGPVNAASVAGVPAPSAASAATGAFPVGPAAGVPAPSAASAATGAFPVGPAAGVPAPSAASAATGAFPVGPVAGVPAPSASMSPRARRQLKVGIGALVLVLVLVVAAVVVVNVLNSRRTPEKEVATYLGLIADGHAQAANEMVDPGVASSKGVLLTDEALSAATSRITSINVEDADVDRGDDSVRITATFRLDGEKFEHTFSLRREDKDYGLLDNWTIEDSLVDKVKLSSTSFDSLTIGGQDVSLDKIDSVGTIDTKEAHYETEQYVYPGLYDIAAGSSRSKYLSPDKTSLRVESSDSSSNRSSGNSSDRSSDSSSDQTVTVEGEPTQDLRDLVLNKVKQETTDCTTVPTNTDSECPPAVQSTHLSKMEVSTEATDVTIDSPSTGFTSSKIVVTTTGTSSTGAVTPRPERSSFTFSGDIEWTEGQEEPTVTVQRAMNSY